MIPLAESVEEADEYNEIIVANNELLLQLINDILDISNIETNGMQFNYQTIELTALFGQIEKTYSTKMPDGVQLVCNIPAETFELFTEKNRLSQVVTNLLNNAIKFTEQGSITFGYEPGAEVVRFYVRDTGRGIAAEQQEKIFERFIKLDSFVRGTGLGLSICQAIVRQFGGQMGVISEVGQGSEFWFTIPLKSIE